MTVFELYDNVNRKTWILQGVVSFSIVIFVWRKKLLDINTENKYYILLVVIILLIKAGIPHYKALKILSRQSSRLSHNRCL